MTPSTFWNKAAKGYAKRPIADTESYEYTLGRTRSYLTPTDHVLEMGCGTGSTALRLADAAGRITASDFSSEMLAIGAQKAKAQGIDNVDFVSADIETGDLAGQSFDMVCAFNVLHLVQDLDAAITGIAAKVRPGGLFISKSPCLSEPALGFKFRLMMLAVPVLQAFGKAPFVGRFSIAELEHSITSAGFEIIETGNHPAQPPARYIVARKQA
ncbi:class I SAM-dependent methyltransferase [Rhodobacteraceae bacterium D3-12]|nr:class I SAM-dependent methyltransferase [Rhodobacteraceae bacterium D3-12]